MMKNSLDTTGHIKNLQPNSLLKINGCDQIYFL